MVVPELDPAADSVPFSEIYFPATHHTHQQHTMRVLACMSAAFVFVIFASPVSCTGNKTAQPTKSSGSHSSGSATASGSAARAGSAQSDASQSGVSQGTATASPPRSDLRVTPCGAHCGLRLPASASLTPTLSLSLL